MNKEMTKIAPNEMTQNRADRILDSKVKPSSMTKNSFSVTGAVSRGAVVFAREGGAARGLTAGTGLSALCRTLFFCVETSLMMLKPRIG